MKNPTPLPERRVFKNKFQLCYCSHKLKRLHGSHTSCVPCKSHWLNLPYHCSQFLEAHYLPSGSILNIVSCFPNTRVWLLVQTLFFDATVFRFLSPFRLTHQCSGSFQTNKALKQWTPRPPLDILEMWHWRPPSLHCWSRSSFCECSYSFKRILNEENAVHSMRTL